MLTARHTNIGDKKQEFWDSLNMKETAAILGTGLWLLFTPLFFP